LEQRGAGLVLDAQRGRADKILIPAANALKGVDPNLISVVALVLALVVGILTYYSFEDWELLLPIISILVLVSGFLDAVDGKVARLVGKAGKRGDFIDHVFDRYADIFMIGGVVVSSWCNIYLGILALLGVLMTSYMGTQAQALGIGRMYAGLLGRADRIVLMFLVPLVQWGYVLITGDKFVDLGWVQFSMFEIMMLWFALVGNLTVVQRGIATWKELK
jgi:archaetidylinositol phosphate synthase